MRDRGTLEHARRGSSFARNGLEKLAILGVLSTLAGALSTSCGASESGEAVERLEQQLGTPVTVSFQQGVSPTAAYAGTIDTSLKQVSPSTNYGSETTLYADGDDGSGVDLSSLIEWSLSGITAGSVVQSATVTVRITNATANTYNVYGMVRPWSEAQATWQNATSSSPWATAGAMAASDRGAVVGTITGSTGSKTITLNSAGISLVQAWVDGGTNAGILIASPSNTDGLNVRSSEYATATDRPKLTITYLPPDGGGGTGGSSGTGGTSGGGAATGGTSTGGTTGGSGGEISTDANLKIAFIGDTDSGSAFTSVLNLIKDEGASAVVVEGDMSYSANPTAWWNALEGVLGTSFPVFISRGNHDDSSWSGYLAKAANHLGGATRVAGAHDANYKTTYRGLVIATVKKGDSGSNITPLLSGDAHIWKICNWHQNQAALQIGGKGDEMGWDVYETCRGLGAIIQTGHEHSYERTKTLTNIASQTVDASCSARGSLCVGPGRTFANVVGLGGNSVRDQTR
ncbi:MAG TPA: DNRLRE domain-containing protein, partial [Polyangiaceae bacterium]|nr:DNRLRE domain-containing protein [Polyangiaceae bacterium]